DGTPAATLYSNSFIVAGDAGADRPVAFFFNGGPGAPTIPLRQGLAPKIIAKAEAEPGFAFVDNPSSAIVQSDLVFVDPVGLGYSRLLDDARGRKYWGVLGDAESITAMIRDWLVKHGRERSPVYLVGESYGGLRV